MSVFKVKGFTLIEILVVILIISIISGIAVTTLTSNQEKELALTAGSITQIILFAEENALLRPATLGLALTPTTFQFFIHQDQGQPWLPLNEQVFSTHVLPEGTQLSLKIADKIVPLDGKPRIIFSQNGDITPFKLYLGKNGNKLLYQIVGLYNGEVKTNALSQ